MLKTIFDWFNSNASSVQAMSTIVLVLITTKYVIDTNKIADTSRTQLDLYTTPSAVVGETINVTVQRDKDNPTILAPLTNFVRFEYAFENIGNVPIRYNGYTSFNNEESESENQPAILYPGQKMKHRTKTYYIEPVKPDNLKGIASVKIVYWGLNSPKEKRFFSRKFRFRENAEGYDIIEDQAGEI